MNKNPFNEKIGQIAAAASAESGAELVYSEVVGTKKSLTVRVFIDKPDGVTVEDCSSVSRSIEAKLDADDFIPSAYLLEVSSPGIERGLYSLPDFVRFAGNRAKVRTHSPIVGQRNFSGVIAAVEGEEIIFDDKTSGTVRFPYSSVAKANLEVNLDLELKNNRKSS